MTHDDEDLIELELLDQRATQAAQGLRRHVDAHMSSEGAPATPVASGRAGRSGARRRVAAVAAAVALAVGAVSTLNTGDDPDQRVDMDDIEALPDLEPGVLTPLGPRDGKDSIQLPIVVEPSTGLTDGQTVAVSGDGFVPGESVGIVQCAREAGGESSETRGGADGCNIGRYESVTADEQGHVEGTFAVTRVLTTPLTGTVDCAAETKRCLVAMGAINDYDRSGGLAIEFAGGGEPLAIPTVTVTPTEGLNDGDNVHVVVDGATPDDGLYIEICSADPVACWATGTPFEVEYDEGGETWTETNLGLRTDWAGRAEGDMPVWRFLPGEAPGTYVDCAVSRCSLRINGRTAPPTVPLGFDSGGEPPAPTSLAVDPAHDLTPGQEVIVRGSGFTPGQEVQPMLCGGPANAAGYTESQCSYTDGPAAVDESGEFAVPFEVISLGDACVDKCMAPEDQISLTCDGVTTRCWITVDRWSVSGVMAAKPIFAPTPVEVTFR